VENKPGEGEYEVVTYKLSDEELEKYKDMEVKE
jgi:hypothetical protein